MASFNYVIDDSTIIELLGVQSFTTKESAVLELVKNAYDACSKTLNIRVTNNSIEFADDGNGMSLDSFEKNWIHVGKSEKGYIILDAEGNNRVLAGSKGIGRFALARLGKSVVMTSYTKNIENGLYWKSDWKSNDYGKLETKGVKGTKYVISGLRDFWSKKNVIELADYLGRAYNDSSMIIHLYYEDEEFKINRKFENPQIGKNFVSKIELDYVAGEKKLKCNIESDEFSQKAEKYCKNINLKKKQISIDIFEEITNLVEFSEIDKKSVLQNIGDFHAELFFSIDRVPVESKELYLYKYSSLENRYNEGVILYRNSFTISSFEGIKDWLGLGIRSRKSPAGPTHPTGIWKVRNNQLSGKVEIDKKNNPYLSDLANRQGLDENDYYRVFLKILDIGISEFERYRQSIIRAINKKNKPEPVVQNETLIIDQVLKEPEKLTSMTVKDQTLFLQSVQNIKKANETNERALIENENRYKYDVRILNVLATAGLKASSIAHELYNSRDAIEENYNAIVSALIKYNIWDDLNSKEKTSIKCENVPRLLLDNHKADEKVLHFMDTMLAGIEKRKFSVNEICIIEFFNSLKEKWESEYSNISIIYDNSSNIVFSLSEDILNVIFDNLIMNSIQQNEMKSLQITIQVTKESNKLFFHYSDNGVGLNKKYLSNPKRILEPHETTRLNNDGHGLGMWIVNNTIDLTGGGISDIYNEQGFNIKFNIGELTKNGK